MNPPPAALPGFAHLLLPLAAAGIAAAAAAIDARRGIIPDRLNAALLSLGVLDALVEGPGRLAVRALDAALLAALLLALRAVYRRRRGRAGLGLGDVKFLAAAALWTGFFGAQLVLLAACLSGLAEMALRGLRGEAVRGASALRFGPHLAAGLVAVLLFQALGADPLDWLLPAPA